jgi:hypothetical protein
MARQRMCEAGKILSMSSTWASFRVWGAKEMRRILLFLLSACALATLSSPSIASGNPYENAAKLEMEHLASSVLAASLCKGVRFHGDTVIPHLAAAAFLLGQKRAEETFFSAIRANIDAMSTNGREVWCAATIKAAKERNSDTLTEDDN